MQTRLKRLICEFEAENKKVKSNKTALIGKFDAFCVIYSRMKVEIRKGVLFGTVYVLVFICSGKRISH